VVKRNVVVAALGMTQTLAWGSSYHLPAILAEPVAQGLGLSRAMVFGVFSGFLELLHLQQSTGFFKPLWDPARQRSSACQIDAGGDEGDADPVYFVWPLVEERYCQQCRQRRHQSSKGGAT
jgi:hypothetical protein